MIHTEELDSILTGNFADYMSDSRLLSPSEIVAAHFDTIGNFDSEQLKIYLSLDELMQTDDAFNNSLATAITQQIEKSFHYQITEEEQEENNAEVHATITSPDFETILDSYKNQLTKWLKPQILFPPELRGEGIKKENFLFPVLKIMRILFLRILSSAFLMMV